MSIGSILSIISNHYEMYISEDESGRIERTVKEGGTGGSFGNISDTDREHLLLFNDDIPIFHELPFRVLFHLPSLMTRLGVVQVTYDHYHFWAWTGEVLREVNEDQDYIDKDIERLFLLTVDFAVGNLVSPPVSKRLWKDNSKIRELVSPHAYRAMLRSHQAATQLSHPLLEGLLRRLCSDYVKVDGRVKSGKKILKMNGNEKGGGRVTNVGDLLHHYENRVADMELAIALGSLRTEIGRFSTSGTGYKIITSWRHPHSHGGERFPGPEHVVLLNIVCQLIWGVIPPQKYSEFDSNRYTEKILGNDIFSYLGHFDYYPLKETEDLLVERDWIPASIA